MIPELIDFTAKAPPSWLLLGLVLACTLGGLPHGAMDGWIGAWWLQPRMGRWWWLPFGIGYLSLSALVIILWHAFPGPSLLGFLVISLLHFSFNRAEASLTVDGTPVPWWQDGFGLWRGTCVILAPILFHTVATAQIFNALTALSTWPVFLAVARPWLLVFGLCCALALLKTIIVQRSRHPSFLRACRITILLTLSAIFLTPLLSFAFYFCCCHSPAHHRETWAEARARLTPRALRRTKHSLVALTVLSMAFLLVGYFLLPATLAADTRLLLTLFVGLAALTAPHMLLQALWERYRQPGMTLAYPVEAATKGWELPILKGSAFDPNLDKLDLKALSEKEELSRFSE